ncbi:hypothetical protein GIB67_036591 [Kingdonia uniflora]|uniref:AT-hook motif nuclear-localized protein n=1 Tax=Kingdonia uniflora TaxID=39325 RepID=A0A7J7MEC3_9MAGN|nr:hypothetical protein GIB67_036591 [Kingdonia uniflora]
MEGNESILSSFYPHRCTTTTTTTSSASISNGIFSNNPHHHYHNHTNNASPTPHFSSQLETSTTTIFPPHSVTGPAPSPHQEPLVVRRKRGRPRKYGPPQPPTQILEPSQTPTTTIASSSSKKDSNSRKKEFSSTTPASYSKKSQLAALGNAGQGFTPHIITVEVGEDVAQKIMSFMQQRKRAVCILSASGAVSVASLRQPASLGGNVTYEDEFNSQHVFVGLRLVYHIALLVFNDFDHLLIDEWISQLDSSSLRIASTEKGRFEILSLSGSFLHSDIGGSSSRTGGLSVCLSGTDGRIVGGGVGGPLKAAGPVQVIVGSFMIDNGIKDAGAEVPVEAPASKLPQNIAGASISSVSFRSIPESVRGNDDNQSIGGNFMFQSRGMQVLPSGLADWRGVMDARGSANTGLIDYAFLLLLPAQLDYSKAIMERNSLNKRKCYVDDAIDGNVTEKSSMAKEDLCDYSNHSPGGNYFGGFFWPPRSFTCTFCKRVFGSAQALGGHMNVHRRDRAKLRLCSPPKDHTGESSNMNPNPSIIDSSLVPSSTRFRAMFTSFPTILPPSPASLSSPSHNSFTEEKIPSINGSSPLNSSSSKKENLEKTMNTLRGFMEEDECKIINLELGLGTDLNKELDLELRLGCS